MSDYPMLISNKLHSFRNFGKQFYHEFLHISKLRISFHLDLEEDLAINHLPYLQRIAKGYNIRMYCQLIKTITSSKEVMV